VRHGYRGDFEFDPVGEVAESLGHEAVLHETARTAAAWLGGTAAANAADDCLSPPRGLHRRGAAGTGSRRSQASSHTVSPG
jgi:hypothetical protein